MSLLEQYQAIGSLDDFKRAMILLRKNELPSSTMMDPDIGPIILEQIESCDALIKYCSLNKSMCENHWKNEYERRFETKRSTNDWRKLFVIRCALQRVAIKCASHYRDCVKKSDYFFRSQFQDVDKYIETYIHRLCVYKIKKIVGFFEDDDTKRYKLAVQFEGQQARMFRYGVDVEQKNAILDLFKRMIFDIILIQLRRQFVKGIESVKAIAIDMVVTPQSLQTEFRDFEFFNDYDYNPHTDEECEDESEEEDEEDSEDSEEEYEEEHGKYLKDVMQMELEDLKQDE